jgi:hypothetical protein
MRAKRLVQIRLVLTGNFEDFRFYWATQEALKGFEQRINLTNNSPV